MKRILILLTISLFVCLTASAFQGGGGEPTKKGLNNKKEETKKKDAGANSRRDAAQSLRRFRPQVQRYERPNESIIALEEGIAAPTAQRISRYFSERCDGCGLVQLEICRVPITTRRDLFLAAFGQGGIVLLSDNGEQITELAPTRTEGARLVSIDEQSARKLRIAELARTQSESGELVKSLNFFVGTDRVLIIVSPGDSYGAADYAYQYKDGRLKPMGVIQVYKPPHSRNSSEPSHSPFDERFEHDEITAEYKQGTYYLTLHGELSDQAFTMRPIATKTSVTTLYFDGNTFQILRNGRPRRRG